MSDGGGFDQRYWRLYRDERARLLTAKHPELRRRLTWRLPLTAAETIAIARRARERWATP